MQSMTKNSNYDIIISSCDAFSDLWEANIKLLRLNWQNDSQKTLLVTDRQTERSFDGIDIITAGEGTEISQRLKKALEAVESKYIVFTLDDYFFTQKINNEKIRTAIEFMENEAVDYVQLYPIPKSFLKRENARQSTKYDGFFFRNLDEGDYKVCLTPGIWRADFMRKTLNGKMNAWQYEVSLTQCAKDNGAVCAVSNNGELPYLDVIRKGKLLRKANRYFKKNPIYKSNRAIMKFSDEFVLGVRTFIRMRMPKRFFIAVKKFMISRGRSFYSPIEEK